MAQLNSGDQIGPFIVEKELSSGGMAHIYQARLSTPKDDLPSRVAVKVAKQGYDDFLRDEEEHLRDLHHPHVIRPVPIPTQTGEIWQKRYIRRTTTSEPTLWYMALEHMEGSSLADLLQFKKKLPPYIAVEVACQVGMALDYLHRARRVAHLDVRPDNILFRQDPLNSNWAPEAILCDFGIAWHNKQVPTDSYGDLPYVAPERRRGDPVAFGCDVYSLGVVLYEMLTGIRPYPQDEERVIVTDPEEELGVPVPPSKLGHGTPQLDAVVLRAIARRPEDRYSTISAFLEDLSPVELGINPRPGRGKAPWKQILKWGSGLLLICLLALASFLAGRQSRVFYPPPTIHTVTLMPSGSLEVSPTPIVITATSIPIQTKDATTVPIEPTTPVIVTTEPTPGVTRGPTSTTRPTDVPTPTNTPRPPTPKPTDTTSP